MNERRRHVLPIAAALLALGCAEHAEHSTATPTGLRFLGTDTNAADFARAREVRPFSFPADHGAHPDYRTEWWYFTGNLDAPGGRMFGFELTFFRYALAPASPPRESAWATRQIWMAHLALTDVGRQRFDAAERLSRGALDLAGARSDRFAVWVENWSATQRDLEAPIRLAASADEFGLELELVPHKAIVLQGNAGLDTKGPENGNASYYYSWPGLAVSGTVRPVGESPVTVTGLAWLDREWGTSALSAGVVGWDWFALQLSDGRDLMFYRLRDVHGNATDASGGTLVAADGTLERLPARSVTLEPQDWWTSPRTGVRYPTVWRVRSSAHELDLLVRPLLADQEIDLSVRYWEGAVSVASLDPDIALTGSGYLELAGYVAR
jgi:predicted secreted hydrolase